MCVCVMRNRYGMCSLEMSWRKLGELSGGGVGLHISLFCVYCVVYLFFSFRQC